MTARHRLAALVAALVLGVLGLHVLGPHHGAAATAYDAPALAAATLDAVGHQDHGAHPGRDTGGQPPSEPGPGEDHHGDALMLCAVMLLAAGLLVLARLVRRPGGRGWTLPRLPRRPKLPARVPILGTGPPPPWRHSIIRC